MLNNYACDGNRHKLVDIVGIDPTLISDEVSVNLKNKGYGAIKEGITIGAAPENVDYIYISEVNDDLRTDDNMIWIGAGGSFDIPRTGVKALDEIWVGGDSPNFYFVITR